MLWPYAKIILALTVPLSTIAYAQQLRFQHDCQRIRSTVEQPVDLQWCLSHPRESLQRYRAEDQYLRGVMRDLDS